MMPTVSSTPKISIIIVNWNGLALLDECLKSLTTQSFQDFEIILVDNGSSDGSVEWIQKNYPNVRLLCLESNIGFSGGNNAGLKLARGQYVALLNNDTKVEPDWLNALYVRISSDEHIAACDSKVLFFARPSTIWGSGGIYTIAGSAQARWGRETDGKDNQCAGDVFVAIACAAIYRRAVIDRIGLFDEDFFAGYEDVDWSFRARLAGYRIMNEPAARVYHIVSATHIHNSSTFIYNSQKNVSITFLKNMPMTLMLKYFPLHFIYCIGCLIYYTKIGKLKAFLRAKGYVVLHLTKILKKRKEIQKLAIVSASEVEVWLEHHWLKNKIKRFFI
jgi:GT2 family glycosyltransferase